MKKAFPYILVICLAIGFIYLNEKNKNVEQGTAPPDAPPSVQWANWEDTQKRFGYDVLGVGESIEWLAKHRDAISIPEKIGFLDTHYLTEMPFHLYGIAITTDQYGRYRVFSRRWLPPWPPEGFMNETESIAWLKAHTVRENRCRIRSKKGSKVRYWERKIFFHCRQTDRLGVNTDILGRHSYSDETGERDRDKGRRFATVK